MIAAVRPQRTSAIENMALSAAITTSQAATRPVPPPKQPPWTSAMVGTGTWFSRSTASAVARETRTFSSADAVAHRVDPFQVGAGLEMPAVALDHHGAQALCAAERIERRQQPLDQLAVVGVVDLRPVQRDGRDAARIDAPENGTIRLRLDHGQSASNFLADCHSLIDAECTL